MSNHREVIIIGSGPAGLTAAIYAARANLKPLQFEGYARGGQLMLTTDVENYPGFREGIMGPDLMEEMKAQAERFGTEIVSKDVERVDLSERPFKMWVEGEEFSADTVIIATGATARLLGVPGESELMGRGVSTCATCDGAFFRDKLIGMVGGGDSAIEEANFLTRFGSKVYVFHRRDALRASKIMQQRAFDNPKIEFVWNSVIEEVYGQDEGKVTSVRVKDTKTGEERTMELSALFVAIGHTPTSEFLGGQIALDENGYILTSGKGAATNVDGVFACGDCQDHTYRQAITAAGSGCTAAIDAERWLEANK
jgi:thioredoxin reductase (NADPH)